jgi:hypothetical protein
MRIVWIALALFCLSGCLFSLDGSLLTRPRESSVRDGRAEGVDRGPAPDIPDAGPTDTAPTETAPVDAVPTPPDQSPPAQ